ncbi:MAG: DUF362 domain-containing protein [Candidatus Latescibacterota bacterium]
MATSRHHEGHRERLLLPRLLALAAVGLLALPLPQDSGAASRQERAAAFVPSEPPNQPMGQGRGIHPGRVVWTHEPAATRWDGHTDTWWTDTATDPALVGAMLSESLRALTGEAAYARAWAALFRHFNRTHGKGEAGYRAGERIAVKLNLNQVRSYSPGNASFTAPQLVLALLRQLVLEAGVPDSLIAFYDVTRLVPDAVLAPCRAEFPHVRFVDWAGAPGREAYRVDRSAPVRWSQELVGEIGGGNPAYLPTVVTQAEYLVNVAHLRGHDVAGISATAKNHFGSICASRGGAPYQLAPKAAGLHPYVAVHDFAPGHPEWVFTGRPPATYNPLVDLMGHRDLGEKTLLYVVDGLYATQTEDLPVGPEQRWQSEPFGGRWTASLFVSQDGVAIDSVCLDFLRSEPTQTWVYGSVDSYLHEAALAGRPPSAVTYDPEGAGTALGSLGVHEHWNNPVDKQYSGNLGRPEGIELVAPGRTTAIAQGMAPAPATLSLASYPNPGNAAVLILCSLAQGGPARLELFDAAGQHLVSLLDAELPAGTRKVVWDGTDAAGRWVGSGLYLVQLRAGDRRITRRIALVR